MRKFTKYPSDYIRSANVPVRQYDPINQTWSDVPYEDSPIASVSQDFKAIAFQQPQGEIYGESFSHVFEVVCIRSYEEDEEEYWSKGCQYSCGTDDGETFYIETNSNLDGSNLDELGCIGPYNVINDISEYFRILSTV